MNIFQQITTYTLEYVQELAELLWVHRTRLISIFLIFIILIPAFLVPPKEKNLIQPLQQTTNNLPSIDPADLIPKIPTINIEIPQGDYSQNLQPRNSPFESGVLDIRVDTIIPDVDKVKESLKVTKKVRYEGKVSWADNLKSNIYSDKFNPGSSVKITHDNKSFIKNIDEKIIMSEDNLLLVSKDIFEEIGGESKTQKSINVVLEQ